MQKSRVSYEKTLRSAAKASGRGLITFSVTYPNGERDEWQMAGNAATCRFAKWAAVLASNPSVFPDLEEIVRQCAEN